jgi:hypothetical protein
VWTYKDTTFLRHCLLRFGTVCSVVFFALTVYVVVIAQLHDTLLRVVNSLSHRWPDSIVSTFHHGVACLLPFRDCTVRSVNSCFQLLTVTCLCGYPQKSCAFFYYLSVWIIYRRRQWSGKCGRGAEPESVAISITELHIFCRRRLLRRR